MQIYRVTYVLLVLVIITGTISITTLRGSMQTPSKQTQSAQDESNEKWRQREAEAKKQFPTAEFDEQEPSDIQKRIALRRKKARYNKFRLVAKNPGPDSGGAGWVPEGQFDFPALPISQSDVIVVGEVVDAQAHLSEDKSNVYSEFTIHISNVYKSPRALPEQITIERIGGYVKYPDGRKLLYQIVSTGMPRVDGKYMLFLKSIPQSEDFTILTGYELGPQGVSPLDSSGQFEVFRGYAESSLLTDLSNSLAKPSSSQE